VTLKDQIQDLEAELTLIIGVALGAAMKGRDVEMLRVLASLNQAKKLADAHPDGLVARLRQGYWQRISPPFQPDALSTE